MCRTHVSPARPGLAPLRLAISTGAAPAPAGWHGLCYAAYVSENDSEENVMATRKKDIQETAAEAAQAAKEAAAEKLSAAREKFSEVASGVEDKVKQIREGAGKASERIREGAERAQGVAREKYTVARDNVRQGYDRVTKDLSQLSDDVTEYVRHNPGKSVAIAAGIGFVIGLLMRGGRRDA